MRHVMSLGAGQGSAASDASLAEKTITACREEGLTQEQADCILAAKTDGELLGLRSCPAIAAKRPTWIVAAPTDQELSEIKDMMYPPVGPKTSSVLYRQLVAKGGTTCGLADNGSAQCWGQRVEVPTGTFMQLGWGWHLCGLPEDGKLACAAHFAGEELSFLPTAPLAAFSEGQFHGCGIVKATGALTCWSKEGWQGDGKAAEPPSGKFTRVASGDGYSCAIKADKSVVCFGPAAPAAPKGAFLEIATMGARACGIKADGKIACWGGEPIVASETIAAMPEGKLTALSCAHRHCCGLGEDGSVSCWGDNGSGRTAAPAGKFTSVLAAAEHSCASGASSTVCWGHGAAGQTDIPASPGDHAWHGTP